MNLNRRTIITWVLIGVAGFLLYNSLQSVNTDTKNIMGYSQFLTDVDNGNVRNVQIDGNKITGTSANGQQFEVYTPEDPNLITNLRQRGVGIEVVAPDEGMPTILAVLLNWFPMLLLIAVWIFLFRQMQGGGKGGAMGFGKSRAKMLTEKQGKVTFEDVAGIEEAKQELMEVVEFLRDPKKFLRLGGKIPEGVLLIGPPGTGKTLTARAVAGEAGVPFFTISGSDFVEMFVGVGASRVRDMFEQGKKNAPCIIFIDELDAVGRHRGAGLGGGNDEREQTLNQMLVEMDGFESNEGVILIAATNRPDVLDPALLRPGRFDRQVVVPNPDVNGREQILKVHIKKVPIAPNVDVKVIARGTPGFSGADLANLVNEAALLAARRNRRLVAMAEFEDAKDKVMMGAERRSLAMSEEEKKLTAYHEAGHALVGIHEPGNDPLHKVTIIPRGRALGVTMNLPERDRLGYKKSEMLARLAMMYGGREAEDIIFGPEHITTGASNDIQQATNMARAMVTEYGMSEKLGALRYQENQDEVFLGHSVARQQSISEKTAQVIDSEVHRICESARKQARKILEDYNDQLHKIAQALLEFETLSGDQVKRLLAGETINPNDEPPHDAKPKSHIPTVGKKGKKGSQNPSGTPEPGVA